MRKPLKRLIEATLVNSGVCRLGRRLRAGDLLILAFHNVVPDHSPSVGDRSLHLARSRFVAFIDHLREAHEIVPLPGALQPTATDRSNGRPRVAITFDDAYRGAVNIGVAELAARGLPATVFVSPAFVDDHAFWWDSYAGQLDGQAFEALRARALDEFRGEDARVRAWAASRRLEEARLPDHSRTATVEEIRCASAHEGITLGSHTWSHPNLARLERGEVLKELVEPVAWLRDRFDAVIPWLAYPYGIQSEDAIAVVEQAGYDAALLVAGGWLSKTAASRYALPRFNVPASLSVRGFQLRVSGL